MMPEEIRLAGEEQMHLCEGTPERVYWHFGYAVALKDVLRLLQGHEQIN